MSDKKDYARKYNQYEKLKQIYLEWGATVFCAGDVTGGIKCIKALKNRGWIMHVSRIKTKTSTGVPTICMTWRITDHGKQVATGERKR